MSVFHLPGNEADKEASVLHLAFQDASPDLTTVLKVLVASTPDQLLSDVESGVVDDAKLDSFAAPLSEAGWREIKGQMAQIYRNIRAKYRKADNSFELEIYKREQFRYEKPHQHEIVRTRLGRDVLHDEFRTRFARWFKKRHPTLRFVYYCQPIRDLEGITNYVPQNLRDRSKAEPPPPGWKTRNTASRGFFRGGKERYAAKWRETGLRRSREYAKYADLFAELDRHLLKETDNRADAPPAIDDHAGPVHFHEMQQLGVRTPEVGSPSTGLLPPFGSILVSRATHDVEALKAEPVTATLVVRHTWFGG